MNVDLYERGKPLGREGLFQLVAEAAFRDGVLEDAEKEILKTVARFLKLDANEAREVLRRSREKFKAGNLGEERALDAKELYRKILGYVASDGDIDELEAEMLRDLRKLFHISDAIHLRTLAEVIPEYRCGPPKA